MKHPWKVGFSFGLTSGVITTLGLMTGLYSGTNSKTIVLAGILTIALADSLSDALGIHTSEESEAKHTQKEIWQATISTFLFKLFSALTFVVPFLFLPLKTAIIICFAWGAVLLTALSVHLAKKQKLNSWAVAIEHLGIATLVIICTHFIGVMVAVAG